MKTIEPLSMSHVKRGALTRRCITGEVLVTAAILILSSVSGARAQSDEGKASHLTPVTLERKRNSHYVSEPANKNDDTRIGTSAEKAGVTHGAHKTSAAKVILRESSPALAAHSGDFYIAGASVKLITDRDGDGHYSEFRVRFDADVAWDDARVYARLYLRRVGERDWLQYHKTDDFYIDGDSDSDDYYVTTTLADNFPTGRYDILIDLYEDGRSGIVASIGPADTSALADVPLEQVSLDRPIQIGGYVIHEVSTTLLIDSDQDGHYSRFRMTLDPDADVEGTYVYAKIWVRPQGGSWELEHISDDFPVHARGTADSYTFVADWIDGYPTAYYDIQIDLHDAATDALAAAVGSERPQLSRVPLEDQARDRYLSPPTRETGGDTHSRERGGGTMTLWSLVALLALGYVKLAHKRNKVP